jgi:heat shock protein HslJ
MSSKKFLDKNKLFLVLVITIFIGSGTYLSVNKSFVPKNQDLKNPNLKNQEYLEKLLAKEWYWVETVVDSSIGIKPYNLTSFKLKFNPDLTFGSSTDCNNLGGSFEVFENKIRFKEIVATEKYCMKSKESEYIEGLEKSSEILINEKGELILKFKDSTTFMRFK